MEWSIGQAVRGAMENIQFEIHHDRIIATVAKQLGLKPSQIELKPISADETSAIVATVRTDLATANKIDRKLARLTSTEDDGETTEE